MIKLKGSHLCVINCLILNNSASSHGCRTKSASQIEQQMIFSFFESKKFVRWSIAQEVLLLYREKFTPRFHHPKLKMWLSSNLNPDKLFLQCVLKASEFIFLENDCMPVYLKYCRTLMSKKRGLVPTVVGCPAKLFHDLCDEASHLKITVLDL